MPETLQVGRIYEIERLVTPDLTADRLGNRGVNVFATPFLVSLLEETCIGCIAPSLNEGQGSVGTKVELQHLAATPVGMTVVSRAELIEIDGRRLVFTVEARDQVEQIAKGTFERFIINSVEKFIARAMEKSTKAGGQGG